MHLSSPWQPDVQEEVSSATDVTRQDAKTTKHMPMDILWLCKIFEFLEQFLQSWYLIAFLGLLYSSITRIWRFPSLYKEVYSLTVENRRLRMPSKDHEWTRKKQHRVITTRTKCKVTNNKCDTKFIIRTEQEPYSNSNNQRKVVLREKWDS